jgi:hypothetical protein
LKKAAPDLRAAFAVPITYTRIAEERIEHEPAPEA